MNTAVAFLGAWLCALSPRLDGGAADGAVPGGEMAALLQETLKRLSVKNLDDGLKAHRAGNHPAALELLRQARELDPENADVLLHLGSVQQALGNAAEAESSWRAALALAPDHTAARLALADLLSARHDPSVLGEVASLLQRVRERNGNDPDVILRQARVAARAGRTEDAERFYGEILRTGRAPPELRLEVGDFLRGLGRDPEARTLYQQLRGDPALGKRAQERLREMDVEEQARRYGWSRPSGEVPAQAHALLVRARGLAAQQRRAEAVEALQEALRVAPQFTDARIELAALRQAEGRMEAAELELLRALAFDQRNADVHARLGNVLLEGESPRAAEAALHLSHALLLRPERTEWNLPLARALRLSGDLPGALARVEAFLANGEMDANHREALSLKLSLQRLLKSDAPPGGAVDGVPTVDPALADRLGRARAYLARGEADAALAELQQVSGTDRDAEVRSLEGRIMMAAGRFAEAAPALEASLRADADQADVREQLGLVRERLGDTTAAQRQLRRAENLGSIEATYHLARLDLETAEKKPVAWIRRLVHAWHARVRVDRFLAATPSGALRADAWAMRDTLDRLLATLLLPAAGVAVLLLALLAAWLERRFGGADLRGLLRRHPETGPQVQRVLAAIRHEVLKHNTMVLTGVVSALERGEDVTAHAEHLRATLFGRGGEPAVLDRLQGYEEELMALGRAHGMRLNLRHKDAALRALHRGFSLLRRLGHSFEGVTGMGVWRRRALLRQVRRAAVMLNAQAYEAVRALLDELRVLGVDGEMLRAIFARVTREPALREVHIDPLQLSTLLPLPVGVAVPRAALEDVLINLFRNSIQASLRAGMSPVVIGLSMEAEVDAVTGLERLLFTVQDRCAATLDLDTVLRQRITGGLGLVAEVVGRYEGSLDVRGPHEGWSKGVVVKLPREELPGTLPAAVGVLEATHA